MSKYNIERFLEAQDLMYDIALQEIVEGKKKSHWIWFIFPQYKHLGRSYNATYYGIENDDEAKEYLDNEILNKHLREITLALLTHHDKCITEIMGSFIDVLKLKASMTMFDKISPNDIYKQVLDTFYENEQIKVLINNFG